MKGKALKVADIKGIPKTSFTEIFIIDPNAIDLEFFSKWVWWWRHLDKYEEWLFGTNDHKNAPMEVFGLGYATEDKHLMLKAAYNQGQEHRLVEHWVNLELKCRIEANPKWRPAHKEKLTLNIGSFDLKNLPLWILDRSIPKPDVVKALFERIEEIREDRESKKKKSSEEPSKVPKKAGRPSSFSWYHLEMIDAYSQFPKSIRGKVIENICEAHGKTGNARKVSNTNTMLAKVWDKL